MAPRRKLLTFDGCSQKEKDKRKETTRKQNKNRIIETRDGIRKENGEEEKN